MIMCANQSLNILKKNFKYFICPPLFNFTLKIIQKIYDIVNRLCRIMKLDSFENGELIGNVVNCSVDEDYIIRSSN